MGRQFVFHVERLDVFKVTLEFITWVRTLDRNFLGLPTEGTGASNDAYNMFGPPSYDDARFLIHDRPLQQIQVRIHY